MHDDLWLAKGAHGQLSVRGCNDFLSEELIFAYQQP